MPTAKRDFYEGAAILALLKATGRVSLVQTPPFVVAEGTWSLYLKYSANPHTTWSFTFSEAERQLLEAENNRRPVILCLICGGDGFVKLGLGDLRTVFSRESVAQRVACTRRHGEYYEVTGPAGGLARKVAPSEWQRLIVDSV